MTISRVICYLEPRLFHSGEADFIMLNAEISEFRPVRSTFLDICHLMLTGAAAGTGTTREFSCLLVSEVWLWSVQLFSYPVGAGDLFLCC